jgi:beta-glucanase (GH16 family)
MKIINTKKFNNSLKLGMIILLAGTIILGFPGCKKDEAPDFNAEFGFDYIDDNHVRFTNNSSGEYYWMVWDYGNGLTDTVADKNFSPEVYFSLAGPYNVTLQVTNYYGTGKSVSKTVNITKDDLAVDFTIQIDENAPNYVMLDNTTIGQYDSFKWQYLDKIFEDQMQHTAYFPFAGDYEIKLVVSLNQQEFSASKSVTIAEDDPDYDPNLLWAEEFNYTGMPDANNWNLETGGGGWGNNELQNYTNSDENSYVENGVLTITAREDGGSYTSARLTTQNKFDFKYGRIEARIKLPYGQGLWPAFWMLGANFSQAGWPYCGEIDIMEMVGGDVEPNSDNTCHATLHWWDDAQQVKADYGLSYTLPSGIFADDFHVFGITWNDQEIRAYVDDNEYFVADLTPDELSEFRQNFFLILNVAVGGNWPGPPDETTVFPQTMQVDWVRVYAE